MPNMKIPINLPLKCTECKCDLMMYEPGVYYHQFPLASHPQFGHCSMCGKYFKTGQMFVEAEVMDNL